MENGATKMNPNAAKLYNLLLNKDKAYPMEFHHEVIGFSMRRITHVFDGAPSCIKGFTMALMQEKTGNEGVQFLFNSIQEADNECAKFLGLETRAAMRLFLPDSQPLETSVLDIIWSHANANPYDFCGLVGARAAAEALKKCCENFPRVTP